jgi:Flp pilus assembly pilin Flp
MFIANRRKKGQPLIEYVVLFCVIIAAVLLIGNYVRNSLAGRWRDAGDSVGAGAVFSLGNTTVVTNTAENRR